ncbi:hypothetical protein DIPPA_20957 [Diplonema papillatum]|nr:hypothetical protein DIPPA_20957 [Diplonema papillatum]
MTVDESAGAGVPDKPGQKRPPLPSPPSPNKKDAEADGLKSLRDGNWRSRNTIYDPKAADAPAEEPLEKIDPEDPPPAADRPHTPDTPPSDTPGKPEAAPLETTKEPPGDGGSDDGGVERSAATSAGSGAERSPELPAAAGAEGGEGKRKVHFDPTSPAAGPSGSPRQPASPRRAGVPPLAGKPSCRDPAHDDSTSPASGELLLSPDNDGSALPWQKLKTTLRASQKEAFSGRSPQARPAPAKGKDSWQAKLRKHLGAAHNGSRDRRIDSPPEAATPTTRERNTSGISTLAPPSTSVYASDDVSSLTMTPMLSAAPGFEAKSQSPLRDAGGGAEWERMDVLKRLAIDLRGTPQHQQRQLQASEMQREDGSPTRSGAPDSQRPSPRIAGSFASTTSSSELYAPERLKAIERQLAAADAELGPAPARRRRASSSSSDYYRAPPRAAGHAKKKTAAREGQGSRASPNRSRRGPASSASPPPLRRPAAKPPAAGTRKAAAAKSASPRARTTHKAPPAQADSGGGGARKRAATGGGVGGSSRTSQKRAAAPRKKAGVDPLLERAERARRLTEELAFDPASVLREASPPAMRRGPSPENFPRHADTATLVGKEAMAWLFESDAAPLAASPQAAFKHAQGSPGSAEAVTGWRRAQSMVLEALARDGSKEWREQSYKKRDAAVQRWTSPERADGCGPEQRGGASDTSGSDSWGVVVHDDEDGDDVDTPASPPPPSREKSANRAGSASARKGSGGRRSRSPPAAGRRRVGEPSKRAVSESSSAAGRDARRSRSPPSAADPYRVEPEPRKRGADLSSSAGFFQQPPGSAAARDARRSRSPPTAADPLRAVPLSAAGFFQQPPGSAAARDARRSRSPPTAADPLRAVPLSAAGFFQQPPGSAAARDARRSRSPPTAADPLRAVPLSAAGFFQQPPGSAAARDARRSRSPPTAADPLRAVPWERSADSTSAAAFFQQPLGSAGGDTFYDLPQDASPPAKKATPRRSPSSPPPKKAAPRTPAEAPGVVSSEVDGGGGASPFGYLLQTQDNARGGVGSPGNTTTRYGRSVHSPQQQLAPVAKGGLASPTPRGVTPAQRFSEASPAPGFGGPVVTTPMARFIKPARSGAGGGYPAHPHPSLPADDDAWTYERLNFTPSRQPGPVDFAPSFFASAASPQQQQQQQQQRGAVSYVDAGPGGSSTGEETAEAYFSEVAPKPAGSGGSDGSRSLPRDDAVHEAAPSIGSRPDDAGFDVLSFPEGQHVGRPSSKRTHPPQKEAVPRKPSRQDSHAASERDAPHPLPASARTASVPHRSDGVGSKKPDTHVRPRTGSGISQPSSFSSNPRGDRDSDPAQQGAYRSRGGQVSQAARKDAARARQTSRASDSTANTPDSRQASFTSSHADTKRAGAAADASRPRQPSQASNADGADAPKAARQASQLSSLRKPSGDVLERSRQGSAVDRQSSQASRGPHPNPEGAPPRSRQVSQTSHHSEFNQPGGLPASQDAEPAGASRPPSDLPRSRQASQASHSDVNPGRSRQGSQAEPQLADNALSRRASQLSVSQEGSGRSKQASQVSLSSDSDNKRASAVDVHGDEDEAAKPANSRSRQSSQASGGNASLNHEQLPTDVRPRSRQASQALSAEIDEQPRDRQDPTSDSLQQSGGPRSRQASQASKADCDPQEIGATDEQQPKSRQPSQASEPKLNEDGEHSRQGSAVDADARSRQVSQASKADCDPQEIGATDEQQPKSRQPSHASEPKLNEHGERSRQGSAVDADARSRRPSQVSNTQSDAQEPTQTSMHKLDEDVGQGGPMDGSNSRQASPKSLPGASPPKQDPLSRRASALSDSVGVGADEADPRVAKKPPDPPPPQHPPPAAPEAPFRKGCSSTAPPAAVTPLQSRPGAASEPRAAGGRGARAGVYGGKTTRTQDASNTKDPLGPTPSPLTRAVHGQPAHPEQGLAVGRTEDNKTAGEASSKRWDPDATPSPLTSRAAQGQPLDPDQRLAVGRNENNKTPGEAPYERWNHSAPRNASGVQKTASEQLARCTREPPAAATDDRHARVHDATKEAAGGPGPPQRLETRPPADAAGTPGDGTSPAGGVAPPVKPVLWSRKRQIAGFAFRLIKADRRLSDRSGAGGRQGAAGRREDPRQGGAGASSDGRPHEGHQAPKLRSGDRVGRDAADDRFVREGGTTHGDTSNRGTRVTPTFPYHEGVPRIGQDGSASGVKVVESTTDASSNRDNRNQRLEPRVTNTILKYDQEPRVGQDGSASGFGGAESTHDASRNRDNRNQRPELRVANTILNYDQEDGSASGFEGVESTNDASSGRVRSRSQRLEPRGTNTIPINYVDQASGFEGVDSTNGASSGRVRSRSQRLDPRGTNTIPINYVDQDGTASGAEGFDSTDDSLDGRSCGRTRGRLEPRGIDCFPPHDGENPYVGQADASPPGLAGGGRQASRNRRAGVVQSGIMKHIDLGSTAGGAGFQRKKFHCVSFADDGGGARGRLRTRAVVIAVPAAAAGASPRSSSGASGRPVQQHKQYTFPSASAGPLRGAGSGFPSVFGEKPPQLREKQRATPGRPRSYASSDDGGRGDTTQTAPSAWRESRVALVSAKTPVRLQSYASSDDDGRGDATQTMPSARRENRFALVSAFSEEPRRYTSQAVADAAKTPDRLQSYANSDDGHSAEARFRGHARRVLSSPCDGGQLVPSSEDSRWRTSSAVSDDDNRSAVPQFHKHAKQHVLSSPRQLVPSSEDSRWRTSSAVTDDDDNHSAVPQFRKHAKQHVLSSPRDAGQFVPSSEDSRWRTSSAATNDDDNHSAVPQLREPTKHLASPTARGYGRIEPSSFVSDDESQRRTPPPRPEASHPRRAFSTASDEDPRLRSGSPARPQPCPAETSRSRSSTVGAFGGELPRRSAPASGCVDPRRAREWREHHGDRGFEGSFGFEPQWPTSSAVTEVNAPLEVWPMAPPTPAAAALSWRSDSSLPSTPLACPHPRAAGAVPAAVRKAGSGEPPPRPPPPPPQPSAGSPSGRRSDSSSSEASSSGCSLPGAGGGGYRGERLPYASPASGATAETAAVPSEAGRRRLPSPLPPPVLPLGGGGEPPSRRAAGRSTPQPPDSTASTPPHGVAASGVDPDYRLTPSRLFTGDEEAQLFPAAGGGTSTLPGVNPECRHAPSRLFTGGDEGAEPFRGSGTPQPPDSAAATPPHEAAPCNPQFGHVPGCRCGAGEKAEPVSPTAGRSQHGAAQPAAPEAGLFRGADDSGRPARQRSAGGEAAARPRRESRDASCDNPGLPRERRRAGSAATARSDGDKRVTRPDLARSRRSRSGGGAAERKDVGVGTDPRSPLARRGRRSQSPGLGLASLSQLCSGDRTPNQEQGSVVPSDAGGGGGCGRPLESQTATTPRGSSGNACDDYQLLLREVGKNIKSVLCVRSPPEAGGLDGHRMTPWSAGPRSFSPPPDEQPAAPGPQGPPEKNERSGRASKVEQRASTAVGEPGEKEGGVGDAGGRHASTPRFTCSPAAAGASEADPRSMGIGGVPAGSQPRGKVKAPLVEDRVSITRDSGAPAAPRRGAGPAALQPRETTPAAPGAAELRNTERDVRTAADAGDPAASPPEHTPPAAARPAPQRAAPARTAEDGNPVASAAAGETPEALGRPRGGAWAAKEGGSTESAAEPRSSGSARGAGGDAKDGDETGLSGSVSTSHTLGPQHGFQATVRHFDWDPETHETWGAEPAESPSATQSGGTTAWQPGSPPVGGGLAGSDNVRAHPLHTSQSRELPRKDDWGQLKTTQSGGTTTWQPGSPAVGGGLAGSENARGDLSLQLKATQSGGTPTGPPGSPPVGRGLSHAPPFEVGEKVVATGFRKNLSMNGSPGTVIGYQEAPAPAKPGRPSEVLVQVEFTIGSVAVRAAQLRRPERQGSFRAQNQARQLELPPEAFAPKRRSASVPPGGDGAPAAAAIRDATGVKTTEHARPAASAEDEEQGDRWNRQGANLPEKSRSDGGAAAAAIRDATGVKTTEHARPAASAEEEEQGDGRNRQSANLPEKSRSDGGAAAAAIRDPFGMQTHPNKARSASSGEEKEDVQRDRQRPNFPEKSGSDWSAASPRQVRDPSEKAGGVFEEERAGRSNRSTLPKAVYDPPGQPRHRGTPEEAEHNPRDRSSPENAESSPPDRSFPETAGGDAARPRSRNTPEKTENHLPDRSSPGEAEHNPRDRSSPEEAAHNLPDRRSPEKAGSGAARPRSRNTPENAGRDAFEQGPSAMRRRGLAPETEPGDAEARQLPPSASRLWGKMRGVVVSGEGEAGQPSVLVTGEGGRLAGVARSALDAQRAAKSDDPSIGAALRSWQSEQGTATASHPKPSRTPSPAPLNPHAASRVSPHFAGDASPDELSATYRMHFHIETVQQPVHPPWMLATRQQVSMNLSRLRSTIRSVAGGIAVLQLRDGFVQGKGMYYTIHDTAEAESMALDVTHRIVCKMPTTTSSECGSGREDSFEAERKASSLQPDTGLSLRSVYRTMKVERRITRSSMCSVDDASAYASYADFPQGVSVLAHGLRRKELNGKQGRVLGRQQQGDVRLVQVDFGDQDQLAVKPKSLAVVCFHPGCVAPPCSKCLHCDRHYCETCTCECLKQEYKEPKAWVNDDAARECSGCKSMFTVTRRRHHCRVCGGLFCASCVRSKIMVPGFDTPQKVCQDCTPSHETRDVVWVPDREANECMQCWASFTQKKRKHHCRACGRVFCDGCSSQRMRVNGHVLPQRVCTRCGRERKERAEPISFRKVSVPSALMNNPVNIMLLGALRVPPAYTDVFVRLRARTAKDQWIGDEATWPLIPGTNKPNWHTTRSLRCLMQEASTLEFRVWNAGMSQDEFIGDATTPLSALRPGRIVQVPVKSSNSSDGCALMITLPVEAPIRKNLLLMRHGESRWNAAKSTGGTTGVVDRLKETDHGLSATGFDQSSLCCAAVDAAMHEDSDLGDLFRKVDFVYSSPLTRAVQTAIIAVNPILRNIEKRAITRKPCLLTRYAREKRNYGGRDTHGSVMGDDIVFRVRNETEKLYDGPVPNTIHFPHIDTSQVDLKWWNDTAETKDEFKMRLDELTNVIRWSQHETILIIGHSHCFRGLVNLLLSPAAKLPPGVTHSDLQTKKLSNCGMLHAVLDFSEYFPMTEVNLLMDTRLVGGKVAKDANEQNFAESDDEGG